MKKILKKLNDKFKKFVISEHGLTIVHTAVVIVMIHSLLLEIITQDWEGVVDGFLILLWIGMYLNVFYQEKKVWKLVERGTTIMGEMTETMQKQQEVIQGLQAKIGELEGELGKKNE